MNRIAYNYIFQGKNGEVGYDDKSYIGQFFKFLEHNTPTSYIGLGGVSEFYQNGYETVQEYALSREQWFSRGMTEELALKLFENSTKIYYYQGPRGIAAFERGILDQFKAIYYGWVNENTCQIRLKELIKQRDELLKSENDLKKCFKLDQDIKSLETIISYKVMYVPSQNSYHIAGQPTHISFSGFSQDFKNHLKKFNGNLDMFDQAEFKKGNLTLYHKLVKAIQLSLSLSDNFRTDIGNLVNEFGFEKFQSCTKVQSQTADECWKSIKFLRVVNKFFSSNKIEVSEKLHPEVREANNLDQLIKSEKELMKKTTEEYQSCKDKDGNNLKFQVKDLLRGRLEVNSYEKLKGAVSAIIKAFEVVELENKLKFNENEAKLAECQNISMVIKYPCKETSSFVFAEIQFVICDNHSEDYKIKKKVNHFLYEMCRHSSGALIALTEIRDEILASKQRKIANTLV